MSLPLFLLITGIAALMMYLPAIIALTQDNHPVSQSFFYSGTLGLIVVTLIGLALANRAPRYGVLGQLLSLFATFTVLPLFLAVPLHDALGNTSFFNAYFDMVSAVTTTGADLYDDPKRLADPLQFWRAFVGWMGGLLMWIAAAAILAPMSLGGFEVTARGEPGRPVEGHGSQLIDPRARLLKITRTLVPLYAGFTGILWVLLLIAGETSIVAICHAMSVLATSGISPVNGLQGSTSGIWGEILMFGFMFFALSRLTFSSDTVTTGYARLDKDPEFRIGLMVVIAVPLLLFLRHWLATYEVDAEFDLTMAAQALWGGMFTVLSFLSTTGFESGSWSMAQHWSGLNTPGLLLMGLALIGGGVATTAGGVKLLRVYALYLNGLREMERLVHPNSVSSGAGANRRIQRDGAYIAWIFFMLFALSLALITVLLTATGIGFEDAILLSVATLSTTGPLIDIAAETPVRLVELQFWAKSILCGAMVLGRLETLAIVALFTPDLWRR